MDTCHEEIVKCDCYDTKTTTEYGWFVERGICKGTKECDECDCGGNKLKCSFYPEVKANAKWDKFFRDNLYDILLNTKPNNENDMEDNGMLTSEMWNRAQNDDRTYSCDDMRYNVKRGFFDPYDDEPWDPDNFDSLENFMKLSGWKETVMTKKEAEEKLGVKIVD